ncbi:MAG: hypothetical protein P1V20_11500 [Verrucomicrobiales bacterium]|nr:hypothetical protein [Verrucomicrobiales bacterium]
MTDTKQKNSRKPVFLILAILLFLLLLLIGFIFLKGCRADSGPVDKTGGDGSDRKIGASLPIAELLNPVPEGAGPFATRVGNSGPVYYIRTEPDSDSQTLNDESGATIYEFGKSDRKAWLAGFTDSRVLIYYTDKDTALTHPKEAWDTRQHFSVSPTSTQFGIGPIFHNEATIKGIVKSME